MGSLEQPIANTGKHVNNRLFFIFSSVFAVGSSSDPMDASHSSQLELLFVDVQGLLWNVELKNRLEVYRGG